MDVNGTRFHLLFGNRDWNPLLAQSSPQDSLEWDAASASVRLTSELFRFPSAIGDRRFTSADRRGTARDRFGNWYSISADRRELRVRFQDARGPGHFWSDGDERASSAPVNAPDFEPLHPPSWPEPREFAGLAVTADHRLVVGVTGLAALFIFDLHAGGPPTELRWPAGLNVRPIEIVAAPCGGVWILDRGDEAVSPPVMRLWFLDRQMRVRLQATDFAPAATAVATDFEPDPLQSIGECLVSRPVPGDAVESAAIAVSGEPVALEVLPDGSLLLLEPQTDHTLLRHFRPSDGTEHIMVLDDIIRNSLADEAAGFELAGHDLAFLPEGDVDDGSYRGRLFVVGQEGNQAFGFSVVEDGGGVGLELIEEYYPMRLFSGRGLTSSGGEVWYDQGESWRALYPQPRPRHTREGTVETGVFDGRVPDCVWHRLTLDGCIPPGGSVTVASRAANREALLAQTPWETQPAAYPRYRSEIPWQAAPENSGTWELLFQSVQGRFMQLRLTLRGTGRNTPRLRALRMWYPRFSYLKAYLPACYRDDAISADFLDRFLANPEGLLTDLEGRIERAQVLFDTRTVPHEYLDWLASWLGVVFQSDWTEEKRRFFLSHAMDFFQIRGTPRGILAALRLALEPCIGPALLDREGSGACGTARSCSGSSVFGVRLIERFVRRPRPGVVLGDTESSSALPIQSITSSVEIHSAYRAFLKERYGFDSKDPSTSLASLRDAWGDGSVTFETVLFPPLRPAHEGQAADWDAFRREALGFTYAPVSAADEEFYREFLQRKYRQVRRLREAWQWPELNAFDEVTLPADDALPDSGQRLQDWLVFVSAVAPMRDYSHRFEVLLPVQPGESSDRVLSRADLVRHVLSLEQPAHVKSEVRFYWAALRVGEARLGLDTLLDRGSRWFAVMLGRSFLADGFLGAGHPWNVNDRMVLGRDAVTRRPVPSRPGEKYS